MAMIRIAMRVYGRVQGVGYRQATAEKALALGLAGFVQNEADGTVYLEAEGPDDKLDALIAWCKQGPPLAHVQLTQVTGKGLPLGVPDFRILR